MSEKLKQDDFYDLIISDKISWQAIIYDLINTEQLDPWDINLIKLSNKYLEKIKNLEEANFVVSSKVLLAAALLLRIKSEILLNKYIKSLDEILLGKEEKPQQEKQDIDVGEVPQLFVKTPLPRHKKVSLQELMQSLEKAMNTETRRIKKQVMQKELEREVEIIMPKNKVNLRDKIKNIYSKIITLTKKKQSRISYSEITNNNKEEMKICFLPTLHLDTQKKIFLEQESHLSEIWVWMYKHYKNTSDVVETKNQINGKKQEILEENEKKVLALENSLADFFSKLE
jgi:segregation and condensation protein A